MGLREYAAAQRAEDNAGDAAQGSNSPAPFYYRGIYNAAIAFHQKHITPPRSDKEWEQAAQEMGEIAAAMNNNPFAIDLLCCVLKEIERQYKAQQQAEDE
jgi:hypothetical protein